MPSSKPIGLYDSGLGGLSVARELQARLPHESLVYVGDTARVPYGGRSPEELLDFNREILEILLEADVKAVVVACNTSSAVALPALESECPVPLLGLIEPGARAAVRTGRRVGVIATSATVKSGAHARAIAALDPACEVLARACPQLVPLVESGVWSGNTAEAVVFESLGDLVEAGLDALVLGCTHYPFLAPVIEAILGDRVRLVDPAQEAVTQLATLLAARDLLAPDTAVPQHRMMASGDPVAFSVNARRLLGESLPPAVHVAVAAASPARLL